MTLIGGTPFMHPAAYDEVRMRAGLPPMPDFLDEEEEEEAEDAELEARARQILVERRKRYTKKMSYGMDSVQQQVMAEELYDFLSTESLNGLVTDVAEEILDGFYCFLLEL